MIIAKYNCQAKPGKKKQSDLIQATVGTQFSTIYLLISFFFKSTNH